MTSSHGRSMRRCNEVHTFLCRHKKVVRKFRRKSFPSGNLRGEFKHRYVQIECAGAGQPCLRHDLEAKAWFCSRKKFKRKGFPQKSRSEFCGKRSSEHRSKAARNTAACEICSAATRAPAKILRSKRSAGMKMQRRRLKVGAAARSLLCRRTFSRRRFIR